MEIKRYYLPAFLLIFCYIQETSCLFGPITGGVIIGGAASLYGGISYYFRGEVCSEQFITKNIPALSNDLNKRLFGQHIVKDIVVGALESHGQSRNPPKALTMSFHGHAGTGKNYVASMIAKNYFKEGENSKFYHFFNGRSQFSQDSEKENYKESLRQEIIERLLECPESVFVFDEVDMMPYGVLNVLVPFMEYGSHRRERLGSKYVDIEINRAVYIFLSNTGSKEILDELLKLWKEGKDRDRTTLSDFEELILNGAFNEKGGFRKSDTISNFLIDHYVPFLPLENKHVKLCIEAMFVERGASPLKELVDEVMTSYVTFGPKPHNMWANSGCKRLDQKVATVIYGSRRQLKNNKQNT